MAPPLVCSQCRRPEGDCFCVGNPFDRSGEEISGPLGFVLFIAVATSLPFILALASRLF